MRTAFLIIVIAIMGCEKDIMTDLTIHNQAFDGILYVDSIYMTDLDLDYSYTMPIVPGIHQVDLSGKYLLRKGYVKSEKIVIKKGHNQHTISLCADCH